MANWYKGLKERWGITSDLQAAVIFVVFGITGTLASKVAAPVTDFVGLSRDAVSGFIYWPVRILMIFPIYQILLIAVGTIFGQFTFFWAFEKKMFSRFQRKRKP